MYQPIPIPCQIDTVPGCTLWYGELASKQITFIIGKTTNFTSTEPKKGPFIAVKDYIKKGLAFA